LLHPLLNFIEEHRLAERIFTVPDAWLNGFYLLIVDLQERSDEHSRDALIALQSCPLLDCWYLERDKEPHDQPRVNAGGDIRDHRYGVLALPNGKKVPCGCFIFHQEYPPDWLEFYIPLAALDKIYPTGAFPFGASDGYTDWEREVDLTLVDVARHLYKHLTFQAGVIGFEPPRATLEDLYYSAAAGIRPEKLWNGYLWAGENGLEWHPPEHSPRY
jgi:hypothetical protein